MIKKKKKKMRLDDAFSLIERDRCWWSVFCISLIANIQFWFAANVIAIIFMQVIPDHYCDVPFFHLTNWTADQFRNFSFPAAESNSDDSGPSWDQCHYYRDMNYTALSTQSLDEARINALQMIAKNNATAKCSNWIYDVDGTMHKTIVTQWNLVCGREYLIATAASALPVGLMISNFLSGVLADKFGRKPVTMFANVVSSLLAIVQGLVPNYYVFFVIRILTALFSMTADYVWVMEHCSPKARKWFASIVYLPWPFAYGALTGFAYWTRDWRKMQLIISVPALLTSLTFLALPESPRWLLAEGRVAEAEAIIQRAAKLNGFKLPPDFKLDPIGEKKTESPPSFFSVIAEVAKRPVLAIRSLLNFYIWFATFSVYYGTSLLISSLSGNIFVNNCISGAVELLGTLPMLPLLVWGRKRSLILIFVVTGLSLIAYVPIPAHIEWAQIFVIMFGRMFITCASNIVYVYSGEMFPTRIRNSFVKTCDTVAAIGQIASFYVNVVAEKNKNLLYIPLCVFAGVSFLAALAMFWLPETKNQPMPETLDEAEKFPNIQKKVDQSDAIKNVLTHVEKF